MNGTFRITAGSPLRHRLIGAERYGAYRAYESIWLSPIDTSGAALIGDSDLCAPLSVFTLSNSDG